MRVNMNRSDRKDICEFGEHGTNHSLMPSQWRLFALTALYTARWPERIIEAHCLEGVQPENSSFCSNLLGLREKNKTAVSHTK